LQTAQDIDGKEQSMEQYAGKVLLITNVASQCGFTESNYKGLQKLYEKYQKKGFEVLRRRLSFLLLNPDPWPPTSEERCNPGAGPGFSLQSVW